MDRTLVVVFDNATKAHDGKRALLQLEAEGSLSVYTCVLVTKRADGLVTVNQEVDTEPLRTLVGTLVGCLVGLLGGPIGFAIGGAAGLLVGGTVDITSGQDWWRLH